MIQIICKGKGLIPRVGMIAPVLTPFKVNLQTLTVIVKTPGSHLKPYFVDPLTLRETALDNNNYKKIYDSYQDAINIIKVQPPEDIETPVYIKPAESNHIDEKVNITIYDQLPVDASKVDPDSFNTATIKPQTIPVITKDFDKEAELDDTTCSDIKPVDASKVDPDSFNTATIKPQTIPIIHKPNDNVSSDSKYNKYNNNNRKNK